MFTSKFIELARVCIPSKVVTIRPNDKPWFTSEIRQLFRKRDRQKRKAISSCKVTEWNKYKHLRNTANNMKKHAKEIFFNNINNK